MRTVFLTGGTGLVGNGIARMFHQAGWRVIFASSTQNLWASAERVDIVPYALDGKANRALRDAIGSSDLVIHAAAARPASGSGVDEDEAFRLNLGGTYELCAMAAAVDVRKFIYISATNIFGNDVVEASETEVPAPQSPYLLAKAMGETIAAHYSRMSCTAFFSLRISAPYGFGYKAKAVIPIFIDHALADRPIELFGKGGRTQTFTYVGDIARACMLAQESDRPDTYNVTGRGPVSMRELAEAVVSAVPNSRSEIVYVDKPDPDEGFVRRIPLDKAKSGLGFEPHFGLQEGLAEMVLQIEQPPPQLVSAC